MTDPINDLIIRVKNAYMTRNESLVVPHSQYKEEVVKKLTQLGYLESYAVLGDLKKTIEIKLRYESGVPGITDVKLVSTAGRRSYVSVDQLKPVMNNMGHSILSTPKGILTNIEARKMKLGGELLFLVW